MTKITTSIDGIHGDIKINIETEQEKKTIELKWCVFDDNGSTGFLMSSIQAPILLTEKAAEHFVRIILSSLIRTFQLKPGELSIINHMGEHLQDVQFLPPTFKGNELELLELVADQGTLIKLWAFYEQKGTIDREVLEVAEMEGIMDDFLSLVQVRASGVLLSVSK